MRLNRLFFPIAMAFLFTGYGLQTNVFPLIATQRGMASHIVSWVSSMHFLCFYIIALLSPFIIRYTGYKISVVGSMLFMALATYLTAHSTHISGFLSARILTGSSITLLYASMDGWINELNSNAVRGRALGVYSCISYLFMMLGASLLHLQAWVALTALPLLACVAVGGGIFCACAAQAPCVPARVSWSNHCMLIALIQHEPVALLGMLVMGMATAPFWDLGPLFIHHINSQIDVATFMVLATLGSAISQWPAGIISDIWGRHRAICICAFLGAFLCLVMVVLRLGHVSSAFLYYSFALLYGLGTAPLYILSAATLFDYTKSKNTFLAITPAYYLIIYGLGGLIGSALNGLLMRTMHWDETTLFFIGFLGFSLCLICSLPLLKKSQKRPFFV